MSGSLLEFPCSFPIKALGREQDDFEQLVLAIIRRHAPDTKPTQVSNRASRRGRYLSVTVTINAESQNQLDAIYRDLSAHECVIMAL